MYKTMLSLMPECSLMTYQGFSHKCCIQHNQVYNGTHTHIPTSSHVHTHTYPLLLVYTHTHIPTSSRVHTHTLSHSPCLIPNMQYRFVPSQSSLSPPSVLPQSSLSPPAVLPQSSRSPPSVLPQSSLTGQCIWSHTCECPTSQILLSRTAVSRVRAAVRRWLQM